MSTLNQFYLRHASESEKDSKKTVGSILATLNEEQRTVVNYLIYKALTFRDKDGKADEDE